MTAKQLFLATQIELNKMQAPSLKLYEFNYLANKSINLFVNKIYNIYDTNQQTTDDIRVLKSTCYLKPIVAKTDSSSYLANESYIVEAPADYLHLLNCVCVFKVKHNYLCYEKGEYRPVSATKLTHDSWSMVVEDIYNKPSINRPYYYIHNVNTSLQLPTNPYNKETGFGTDSTVIDLKFVNRHWILKDSNGNVIQEPVDVVEENTNSTSITITINQGLSKHSSDGVVIEYYNSSNTFTGVLELVKEVSNLPRTTGFKLNLGQSALLNDSNGLTLQDSNYTQLTSSDGITTISKIEKPATSRVSNQSSVRIEIRCGRDRSVFELAEVQIDYLKSPLYLQLTTELLDMTIDTSLVLEFPDYVCQEIINGLVALIMEHSSDPRLQNYPNMNISIARSTQGAEQA